MELKISTTVENTEELKKFVSEIEKIEKEHSCNCTLEISIG